MIVYESLRCPEEHIVVIWTITVINSKILKLTTFPSPYPFRKHDNTNPPVTMSKTILTIGLALPPSPETSAMQAAVGAAMKRANEEGYRAEMYAMDRQDAHRMDNFRGFLKCRTWDGVMIGWGIRGIPEHTELFEELVNMVVAEVKPAPKFIFSLKPDGLIDAIQRVLGKEN